MPVVDHLMMGVADAQATATRWEAEHGLKTIPGFRFDDAPAFGNSAVPLGETWVEMVAVVDPEAADGDPQAEMFSAVVAGGDRLLGWALAPEDFDDVAAQRGLPISLQHATHSVTGEQITWRQAGFDETRMEPYLPFFVGWDHDAHAEIRRDTENVGNAVARQADVRLELTGSPDRFQDWLRGIEVPATITPGPPSIVAHVRTDRGVLTIR